MRQWVLRSIVIGIVVLVVVIILFFAFYGAVLWATILAILFTSWYRRLSRAMGQRRTLAALAEVVVAPAEDRRDQPDAGVPAPGGDLLDAGKHRDRRGPIHSRHRPAETLSHGRCASW